MPELATIEKKQERCRWKKGRQDESCLRAQFAACSRFLRRHSQSGCIVLKEKPPAVKMSFVADMVHRCHRRRRCRRHRR